MRLYSTGYLAFGVQIDRHLEEGLETSGAIRKFNKANGSEIGYLTAGSFEDDALFLVTYCESAEPGERKYLPLRSVTRKRQTVWKRQIEKFLRENSIQPRDRIGLRLLADLDN